MRVPLTGDDTDGTMMKRGGAPFGMSSVSVVIPVYNAAAFVESAVRSALGCEEVGEVILVEDGSTDGSARLCADLRVLDPRIRVLQHAGGMNKGAGASRNRGMEEASMPFVAFLDADDRFLADRFAAEHRVFREVPDAQGVYGAIGSEFMDEGARERYMARFGTEVVTVHQVVGPDELCSALLGGVPRFGHFSLDALTVRRAALSDSGIRFNELLPLHQDTDFLIRLAHAAVLHPGRLDEPVAMRRVHAGNRITVRKDEAERKHEVYRSLFEWARSRSLTRSDRRRILARMIHWDLARTTGRWAAWYHLRFLVMHPWLLGWVKLREAWFDRLFGAGTWPDRALTMITWRLWGDRGSYL